MEKKDSLCQLCRYYYITWDKAFPFGCRAMGFKSRTAPSLLTKELSGQPCLSFAAKEKAAKSE